MYRAAIKPVLTSAYSEGTGTRVCQQDSTLLGWSLAAVHPEAQPRGAEGHISLKSLIFQQSYSPNAGLPQHVCQLYSSPPSGSCVPLSVSIVLPFRCRLPIRSHIFHKSRNKVDITTFICFPGKELENLLNVKFSY